MKFKNLFLQNQCAYFNQTLLKTSLGEEDSKILQIRNIHISKKEDHVFISLYQHYGIIITAKICLLIGTVSQVSYMAHGPLRLLFAVKCFLLFLEKPDYFLDLFYL